ncbi:hypothetical protein CYMTET_45855 [Cymbomonas tetramitiformis]|uniref:Uncharacterized protein n=1 Tax=Cymbomonas tetramitiformis TaxID=36881 RepID=A0AAE0BYR9_9CHLO|nr:hypothetical protein CYMTET_45855 [Cymbomonas tetramitiformis]
MSRPEHTAPAEVFYNDTEAKKYTASTRMMEIQETLTKRALELLALPQDGSPKLLLDIGCGSGLSGQTISEEGHHWIGMDISPSMLEVAQEIEAEGDLLLADMGQGVPMRPAMFDGAISISAVQWLCNADSTAHNPRLRLKQFFSTLYRSLARGARAILQIYPESMQQAEMITMAAMRAGFSGGLVVDYPNSARAKKHYLCLMAGAATTAALPAAKGLDGSDDEDDPESVQFAERARGKRRKGADGGAVAGATKRHPDGKGRNWVLKKKDKRRKQGYMDVPEDTKYTARKRKSKHLS